MTQSLTTRWGAFALAIAGTLAPAGALAQILITEVLPGVTTVDVRGDTVELFNAGNGAVDLTGFVLSDLDPASSESDLLSEGTFAPPALNLPELQPGEFAVVQFVDSTVVANATFIQTNYGLRINSPQATNASSYLGNTDEQLVLLDAAGVPLDFVAWYDSGDAISSDSREDMAAFTAPTADYGIDLTDLAWAGTDAIANTAEYQAAAVDFTGFSGVTTYGGGALRRLSVNGVFQVATPRTAANWQAIPREDARLGNPSDRVPTADGFLPIRITDDLPSWTGDLDSSFHPDRRVARGEDQSPADFIPPSDVDQTAFQALVARMLAGEFEGAFADAIPLGYEVVEFLDEDSGITFMLLREIETPGDVGFTGQGVFFFGIGPDTRPDLCLQAPHPIFDSLTINQLGLAIPQLEPRVAMVAGTHRNNSTSTTLCDGTFSGGLPYRISDVAHFEDNFFHATHRHLQATNPDMVHVQFHGFCCPGDPQDYPDLTDDVVASSGFDQAPQANSLVQLFADRVAAQNFFADDGSLNGDLTTTAIFGDTTDELGATNNIQGRITNGVAEADACDTPAGGASGRFLHIEQDPDVREEPQHIITALGEALDLFGVTLWVELETFEATLPPPFTHALITWKTGAEIDSLGFRLYRGARGANGWSKADALDTELIPAQGTGGGGASYAFEDPVPVETADIERAYYLEEWDSNGKATLFGPVLLRDPRHASQASLGAWPLF
ncbi:MAG: lamin tail domain-containing protein [Sumerlaeia bacterium]